MHISIEIPIQAYLKKYVLRNTKDDFLEVSVGTNNHTTDYIHTILSTNYVEADDRRKRDPYSETLRLMVPWHFAREGKFYFSHKHVIRIHRFIKSTMSEKIFDVLDEICENRGDIKKNMAKQLDKYGITETDFPLQTALKDYYRYRKKKGMENLL